MMYNIKKYIDKLNRGEPTFYLEPNEVKEISKCLKKDKFKNREVILNYEVLTNLSYLLKEEDIFSIRKYGKFKYIGKVKQTKKIIILLRYINISNIIILRTSH